MKEGNIHFFLNFEKLVKREKALLFETLVTVPATDFMPGHVHSAVCACYHSAPVRMEGPGRWLLLLYY